MNSLLDVIKKNWEESDYLKRSLIVAGLLVLFVLLTLGTMWVVRDDYQILFSDLNPQDAAAMVAELEKLKTSYKLADDGKTILVEGDTVYKTRLKLMGKGLNLQGSVGFEIFNNAEFGMTEFAQKVNYQRALQGELARTIMGFEEIKSARVHLVLPESGLFKRENAKPKASVSIAMKDDAVLTPDQIFGIQRLVAASVPEINPSEVTVVDQRGVAVTKQLFSDDGNAQLPEKLEMKKQVEDYMVRKILNVVDRVAGPGKAIVSVDVSLNYDQSKLLKEDIVPMANSFGQDVGAVTRRRESSQGGVGIQDNLIPGGSVRTSSTEVEFSNSRRIENVLSSRGNILRLSVGVLLPSDYDPVRLAKLKEIVAMAVGINASRGDGLVVYSVDLPEPSSAQPTNTAIGVTTDLPILQTEKMRMDRKSSLDIPKNAWLLGLGLLVLMFLIYIIQRISSKRNELKSPPMDPIEREKLLSEISQWLNVQGS